MAYALQPASAKFILDFFPEFLIDNRLMLSLVEFIIMLDFPNVKGIRKKPVDFIPRPAVRLVMSSCIDGGPVLGFDAVRLPDCPYLPMISMARVMASGMLSPDGLRPWPRFPASRIMHRAMRPLASTRSDSAE